MYKLHVHECKLASFTHTQESYYQPIFYLPLQMVTLTAVKATAVHWQHAETGLYTLVHEFTYHLERLSAQ